MAAHAERSGAGPEPQSEPGTGPGSAPGAASASDSDSGSGSGSDDASRIDELEEQVGQLREAVTSHAVVDQAIGMMVALGRVTPEQGWTVLRDVSQHTNVKLRHVAELVLVWGRTGEMPQEIRAELEDALDRYGPTQIPGAPTE